MFPSQCIDFLIRPHTHTHKTVKRKKKWQPTRLAPSLFSFYRSAIQTHAHIYIYIYRSTHQVRWRSEEKETRATPGKSHAHTNIGWQSAEADGWTKMMMAPGDERNKKRKKGERKINGCFSIHVDWMFNPLDVY